MGNRYAEDIIRIVGIDQKQSELGKGLTRQQIESKRGIAYWDGQSVQGVSGSGAGSSGGGTSLGPITLRGDTGLGANGDGSSTHSESDGDFDIEDLLDGDYPSYGNEPGSGESINKLSGLKDCDSGDNLDLRFDGIFLPPSDWVDADTPPLLPLEEQENAGTWWSMVAWGQVGSAITPSTCSARGASPLDVLNNGFTGCIGDGGLQEITQFNAAGDNATAIVISVSNNQWQVELSRTFCSILEANCPSSNQFNEDLQYWPADGVMQLALIDGFWQTHPKEHPDDRIAKYNANNSTKIDYCFGDGRTGTIEPTKNGGFLVYETNVEGEPFKPALIINNDQKILGTLTPEEVPYHRAN